MSLCQCQRWTIEKGKKQSICSPLSLPSLLSLSGFYLANGGLPADWCWVSLKPEQYCACVCVCVCVCVLVLIRQSSVIIPQQGLAMPSGHLSFSHTNKRRGELLQHWRRTRESESEGGREAWSLGSRVAKDIRILIEPAHQTAPEPLSRCLCFIKICGVNVRQIPGVI